jgi:hypothetical protein
MSEPTEIRIKTPPEVLNQWKRAAALRNLSVAAFISSLVSAELLRTGELSITAVTSTNTPPKVAPAKPALKDFSSVAEAWAEDEDDIPPYVPDKSVETSRERLARLQREAEESGEYDDT